MSDADFQARLIEGEWRASVLVEVERLWTLGLTVSVAVFQTANDEGISASSIWRWRRKVAGLRQSDWKRALIPLRLGPVLNLSPNRIISRGMR